MNSTVTTMCTRARLLTLLALLGALAACGKSPAATVCAKGAECQLLPAGQTEQQCTANSEKSYDDLRANADCTLVVAKYDALADCVGTLSCTDATKQLSDTKCSSQYGDFVGAVLVNAGKCHPPTMGSGMSDGSGGAGVGGVTASSAGVGGAGGM